MDSIAVQLPMTMEAFWVKYVKSASCKDPQIEVSSLLLLSEETGHGHMMVIIIFL